MSQGYVIPPVISGLVNLTWALVCQHLRLFNETLSSETYGSWNHVAGNPSPNANEPIPSLPHSSKP